MKRCSKCEATKPFTEFYTMGRERRDEYQSRCKACTKAASVAYKKANPLTPEQKRRQHLKYQYGITPEGYEMTLKVQGGKCAICGGDPDGRWGRFYVDHDHASGAIRGLLCGGCNLGLGAFKDNPDSLAAAIEYLGVFAAPN